MSRSIIIGLVLVMMGCTHTRQFQDHDEVNSILKDKTAKITLQDGTSFKARFIQIKTDSTYWVHPRDTSRQVLPTSEIKEIVLLNRGRGAWEGFRPFLIGGGILGLIGFADGDDPPGWFSFTAEEKAAVLLIGTAVYGVILGVPVGAAVGSKDKYLLPKKDQTGE